MQGKLSVFSQAIDTLIQQSFAFNAPDAAFVDLVIKSNHAYPPRKYVDFYEINFTGTLIPEPTTILLLSTGLIGLLGFGIRHRRRKQS